MQSELKEKLKDYGLEEKDINKILTGEVSYETLLKEIESESNSDRRSLILLNSYFRAFEIPCHSLSELDRLISDLKKDATKKDIQIIMPLNE